MNPMSINNVAVSPRLHFPVYGQFGFDEPVGKRKYLPRFSPVHRLIFNHQLPQLSIEEQQEIRRRFVEKIRAQELPRFGQYLGQSRQLSIPINHSSIYSPEGSNNQAFYDRAGNFQKGDPQDLCHQKQDKSIDIKSKKFESQEERRLGRNLSVRNEYQSRKKMQEYMKMNDSLDSLVNQSKGQDLKKNKKEQTLDGMIKHKFRNPTFLTSHLA